MYMMKRYVLSKEERERERGCLKCVWTRTGSSSGEVEGDLFAPLCVLLADVTDTHTQRKIERGVTHLRICMEMYTSHSHVPSIQRTGGRKKLKKSFFRSSAKDKISKTTFFDENEVWTSSRMDGWLVGWLDGTCHFTELKYLKLLFLLTLNMIVVVVIILLSSFQNIVLTSLACELSRTIFYLPRFAAENYDCRAGAG